MVDTVKGLTEIEQYGINFMPFDDGKIRKCL